MGLFDKVLAGIGDMVNQANGSKGLNKEFMTDGVYTLRSMPDNLEELKAAVDVTDPRSVAAYWLYSVMCLTADYDTGMSMMKYLFADIEPFGRGFIEGGGAGKAGWDTYFNERLEDDDYRWLPRAYFQGATADNGFHPSQPLSVYLDYNDGESSTINAQSVDALGRLNAVYNIKSNAAGNIVKVTVSKFDGCDRWYVTSGTSCKAVFYDQRAALTATARAKLYQ